MWLTSLPSKTLYYDVTPFMYYVMVRGVLWCSLVPDLPLPSSVNETLTGAMSSAISRKRRNLLTTTTLPVS